MILSFLQLQSDRLASIKHNEQKSILNSFWQGKECQMTVSSKQSSSYISRGYLGTLLL